MEDKNTMIERFKEHFKINSTTFSRAKLSSVIDKFKLILVNENDETVSKDDNGNYQPSLVQGQIVQVRFVGQGNTVDGKHFAIVYDVSPRVGHVTVLPMTSQPVNSFYNFDLGLIEGLSKSVNVVKFNQVQTVARDAIHIWNKTVQDENGNRKRAVAMLDDLQMLIVKSYFRLIYMKEKDLFYKLYFTFNEFVPKVIPDELRQHLNKVLRVEFDKKNKKMKYKLPIHASDQVIEFEKLKETSKLEAFKKLLTQEVEV